MNKRSFFAVFLACFLTISVVGETLPLAAATDNEANSRAQASASSDFDVLDFLPAMIMSFYGRKAKETPDPEFTELLDSLTTIPYSSASLLLPGEIVHLPNGVEVPNECDKTKNTQLTNELKAKLVSGAAVFTNRIYWSGITSQPNGLAYSYGQDNYLKQEPPPADGGCDPVFGLDCSGMVMNALDSAGIPCIGRPTSTTFSRAAYLQSIIDKAPEYKGKVSAKAYPELDFSMLTYGDIIYFLKGQRNEDKEIIGCTATVQHVGIVGNGTVIQSNGAPEECENNQGPTRGPRIVSALDITAGWFKGCWGVVRFEPKCDNETDNETASITIELSEETS